VVLVHKHRHGEERFKKSFTSTAFSMKLPNPIADIKINGLKG
jgi:hypothetical protein